jgi:hypothetical protein
MKKLLLSGITAFALMASVPAQAGGLSVLGETGLARTPLAMSLAPMQMQIAADYVSSDALYVPVRLELGLPYGIEVGGAYHYIDLDDTTVWSLNGKWVFPEFVKGLGLAVGGHYNAQEVMKAENDGYDLYAVGTFTVPMGEGMAIVPSFGAKWVSRDGGEFEDDTVDAFKWFGSLLFKTSKFALGGEYVSADDDYDGEALDGFYWLGGRFFLNPMITLQAGYLNNTNFSDGSEKYEDGTFHAGLQFAFGGGK